MIRQQYIRLVTLCCAAITVVITCPVFSQSDIGAWTAAGLQIEKSKDLQFGIDAEMRFDRNISRLEQYFVSAGLQYDLNRIFRVGSAYRYSIEKKDNDAGQRGTLDLEFRNLASTILKTERFDMELRLRSTMHWFQYSRMESVIRGRLLISYDTGKNLKPELSAELFYRINDQLIYAESEIYGISRVTKLRWRAGVDYSHQQHGLVIFYQYQDAVGSVDSNHVAGLTYTYTIDLKK